VRLFPHFLNITITRDDITLTLACIGTVLGILAAFANWRQRRVRISVKPFLHADTRDGGNLLWVTKSPSGPASDFINGPFFGVEVRNHGVPVTIDQIGLTRRRDRMLFTFTDLLPGGDKLPARMENEDALRLFTNVRAAEAWALLGEPHRAYVLTSTDKMFTGDSEAPAQVRSEMRRS